MSRAPHYGSRDTESCQAAGILPLSIDGQGRIIVLFGEEVEGDGWSEFGGGREPGETIAQCAAREYEEETMSMWYNREEMLTILNSQRLLATYNNGKYLQYLVYFPYSEWVVNQFNRVFDHLRSSVERIGQQPLELGWEKSRVRWFSLSALLEETTIEKIRPCCRDNLRRIGHHYERLLHQHWIKEKFMINKSYIQQ